MLLNLHITQVAFNLNIILQMKYFDPFIYISYLCFMYFPEIMCLYNVTYIRYVTNCT